MFVNSQLLLHKKSHSVCESSPTVKKSSSSPQTSPLLRRAISPSGIKRGAKPKRAITIPRAREIQYQRSPKVVSIVTPDSFGGKVPEVEGEEEGLLESVTQF